MRALKSTRLQKFRVRLFCFTFSSVHTSKLRAGGGCREKAEGNVRRGNCSRDMYWGDVWIPYFHCVCKPASFVHSRNQKADCIGTGCGNWNGNGNAGTHGIGQNVDSGCIFDSWTSFVAGAAFASWDAMGVTTLQNWGEPAAMHRCHMKLITMTG